jgi:hypothetical protein
MPLSSSKIFFERITSAFRKKGDFIFTGLNFLTVCPRIVLVFHWLMFISKTVLRIYVRCLKKVQIRRVKNKWALHSIKNILVDYKKWVKIYSTNFCFEYTFKLVKANKSDKLSKFCTYLIFGNFASKTK